jgi:molybdopterin biosynthesis enzyme
MTLIKTEDAVGQVLCHDITQIIPGTYKGARFRKGHIVSPEDIPVLLSIGKEHLYIWEKKSGTLHEEEAAEILCTLCQGPNIERGKVREGKIELSASCAGLFKVKSTSLFAINSLGGIIIATKGGNSRVKQGDKLAGVKVVPLVIDEEPLRKAEALAGGEKILEVLPFTPKRVGLIVTGSEVYHKRIKDGFTPVIQEKLSAYDAVECALPVVLDDDNQQITEQCLSMIEDRCNLIICTGGMSVDPDDKTPLAIKNTGADIVSYGAPVLPGGMFMLSYYKKENQRIPIIGLPACVMYSKQTVFDLILPRIMADDEISKESLAALGEGGLL